MKTLYKVSLLLSLLFILSGCVRVHNIQMVDFNSNETLMGVFDERDNSVFVTMPDGEVLSGGYSSISNDGAVSFSNSFGFSSGRYYNGGFGGVGVGFNLNAESTKYALVTSKTSELKMEILMSIRSWTKDGFGEAKTNDGRVYKIQF